MTRIKSAAFAALGLFVALAGLGFFATFGLALIGVFALLSLVGVVAAGAVALFGPKQDLRTVEA